MELIQIIERTTVAILETTCLALTIAALLNQYIQPETDEDNEVNGTITAMFAIFAFLGGMIGLILGTRWHIPISQMPPYELPAGIVMVMIGLISYRPLNMLLSKESVFNSGKAMAYASYMSAFIAICIGTMALALGMH